MQWVCLHDKARLAAADAQSLVCEHCHRRYAVDDGIPVFSRPAQEDAPVLEALYRSLLDLGVDAAAEQACRGEGCVRRPLTTDWSFFAPVHSGTRILQIGGGYGDVAVELSHVASSVQVLAPSPAHARIVRAHANRRGRENLSVSAATDLRQLPLASACVDLIAVDDAALSGFGIARRTLAQAFAEWRRVLAPGGALIVAVRNGAWASRLLGNRLGGEDPETLDRRLNRAGARGPVARLGPKRFLRAARGLGFSPSRIHGMIRHDRDMVVVLPVHDAGVVRWCLRHLQRRNAPLARLAVAASGVVEASGVLRCLLPFYILVFPVAEVSAATEGAGP